MTTAANSRRYDLDWLRVMAILVVFFYHSVRFFNLNDWHVKNTDTYLWVELLTIFLNRWMMPLFFVISGASLFYVVGKRAGFSKFYSSKFLRLMIPVVVASVTHGALQSYFEKSSHGIYTGSFFSFIPHYFEGIYFKIGASGNFAFAGMHLWYLLILFCFSLICYPLFLWLNGSGNTVLNRITRLFAKPGFIYLWFALPLFLIKLLIPASVLYAGAGGWGFVYYLWFLISGYFIISSTVIQQAINHHRWISLGLGISLSSLYLCHLVGPLGQLFPGDIAIWVNTSLSFFSTWCWLFTILGFGMRYLAVERPILRHANEGVLAFYILHQTVLQVFGYFVVRWNMGDLVKWMIITAAAFITIMVLYTLIIRKSELLRFFFGMKSKHKFAKLFGRGIPLAGVHLLYIGLFVFAIVKPSSDAGLTTLAYDTRHDVVLNAASIVHQSSTGVRVSDDLAASSGKAIEFVSGAHQRAVSNPIVFIELQFSAPAGQYFVWLRGKSDIDDKMTDSIWLQADHYVGTWLGGVRLGNWLDVHPAGNYRWVSDGNETKMIHLPHSGEHTIRIQPRQVPHRIDQIWLSRRQLRIPDTGISIP